MRPMIRVVTAMALAFFSTLTSARAADADTEFDAFLARWRAAVAANDVDAVVAMTRLPFLFEGRLPDLNLGTALGASCTPATQARLARVMEGQDAYDHVANGRFKGGYITRHYGRPADGVEAIQLETSQRCYMDEDSFAWDAGKAARLQPLLRKLLEAALG